MSTKSGRKKRDRWHVPTEENRKRVAELAGLGLPLVHVARVIGIDAKTLDKYYRDEIDKGKAEAHAQVVGCLFRSIKKGNVVAQIFWLKTQLGWQGDGSQATAQKMPRPVFSVTEEPPRDESEAADERRTGTDDSK